jgi:hypothetical protein
MTFIHPDPTFNFNFNINLSAGNYYLDRRIMPGYIVREVEFEGRDVLEKGFSVLGPGKMSLEIKLSKDGGQIDGVVADKDGKLVPGATAVLVPEASCRSHFDLYQNVEADQQGDTRRNRFRLAITSCSPGTMLKRGSGRIRIF